MALQYSLTLESGITCPEAYARISSIQHTHSETVVSVQTFASASARQADKSPVSTLSYSIPWSDGVSLTGAYTALKSINEFSAALDV